jgi:hypothetical protein
MNSTVAQFFLTQLHPYHQYVEDIAKIDFVPYGTTQRDGEGFHCELGDIQCNANKIHVIIVYELQSNLNLFINEFFENLYPYQTCMIHNFYDRANHTNDIDIDESRLKTVGFFICVFSRNLSDPINEAEYCLNEVFGGDYWGLIDECARGPDAKELYTAMATKTEALDPPLNHVPTVTINNTQNGDAENNLIKALCNAYSVGIQPLSY